MTMGIVAVAFLAATAAGVEPVRMTSTLARTRSAARSGSLSVLPSADRCSITMLRPSTHPTSRRPRTNASNIGLVEKSVGQRTPTRYGFPGVWAPAVAKGAASRRRATAAAHQVLTRLTTPPEHAMPCNRRHLGGSSLPLVSTWICPTQPLSAGASQRELRTAEAACSTDSAAYRAIDGPIHPTGSPGRRAV